MLLHNSADASGVSVFLTYFIFLYIVGPVPDDVYHSEEDPPPFHENQDFDFGFDNKSIRRAFVRKVRTLRTLGKLVLS